ncbi:MAG TPA: Mov34/MPN/PAD-1 family protein [Chloroflexota bacterium]|nr:Mov34/MPN/PAD-1 family protein [Chloroflexota bacterium]
MTGAKLALVRPYGGAFEIGPLPLSIIRSFAQVDPGDKEAGGVLLGRYIAGTRDVVVDAVTVPLPGDVRHRTSFFRARRRHQDAIDEAWRTSEGTCTYLGEWHTHPEAMPSPSCIDTRDWSRRLTQDRFSGDLFFVVAGTEAIRAWEGRRGRSNLRTLRSV